MTLLNTSLSPLQLVNSWTRAFWLWSHQQAAHLPAPCSPWRMPCTSPTCTSRGTAMVHLGPPAASTRALVGSATRSQPVHQSASMMSCWRWWRSYAGRSSSSSMTLSMVGDTTALVLICWIANFPMLRQLRAVSLEVFSWLELKVCGLKMLILFYIFYIHKIKITQKQRDFQLSLACLCCFKCSIKIIGKALGMAAGCWLLEWFLMFSPSMSKCCSWNFSDRLPVIPVCFE